MRQLEFTAEHGFTLVETDVQRPAPGEVLVRVLVCGICGSDRAVAGGGAVPPGTRFPLVMGHEICGMIADANGSTAFESGDRVVVMPYAACDECQACRSGNEHLCAAQQLIGYHRAGGLAAFVSVPERAVLPCPPSVSDAAAAVLVDAFATPFHALCSVLRVSDGSPVLVQGFGGTGQAAVMLLKAMGIPAAVVTRRPEAGAAAEAAGAQVVFNSAEDSRQFGRAVRRWSGGGVDFVLDTIGSQTSIQQALDLTRAGGQICVIGLNDEVINWPMAKAVRRSIGLLSSFSATRADASVLLQWAASGRIHPEQLIGAEVSLEDAATAFTNPASGRTVVRP